MVNVIGKKKYTNEEALVRAQERQPTFTVGDKQVSKEEYDKSLRVVTSLTTHPYTSMFFDPEGLLSISDI